jgi:hypothetical protein
MVSQGIETDSHRACLAVQKTSPDLTLDLANANMSRNPGDDEIGWRQTSPSKSHKNIKHGMEQQRIL